MKKSSSFSQPIFKTRRYVNCPWKVSLFVLEGVINQLHSHLQKTKLLSNFIKFASEHEPFKSVTEQWREDNFFTDLRFAGPNPLAIRKVTPPRGELPNDHCTTTLIPLIPLSRPVANVRILQIGARIVTVNNLGPVHMGKSCPGDPAHPSPRVPLGVPAIHTFLYKSKQAFT